MDEETDTAPDGAFDACTGRKRKASCSQCSASDCTDHLVMHDVRSSKRHKLVASTGRLEHDKLAQVFDGTDQLSIRRLCVLRKHRDHDVVPVDYKVAEVQSNPVSTQKDLTDRIKTRQRQRRELQQAIKAFQTSARQAVEENEKRFTQMIQAVEKRQHAVKKLILDREKAAAETAEELLERLPSEICDLKKRDVELRRLEALYQRDSGVHFLQGILSTPAFTSSLPSPVLFVHPYSSFDLASEAVSALVSRLRRVCNLHFTAISEHVKTVKILTSPDVLTKRDALMQSASKLTLNLDTAHVSLLLSRKNTRVTVVHPSLHYPDHRDRFDRRAQILCEEILQGAPNYWEVEYGCSPWVCIAVSYVGIHRKGKRGRLFGRNRYSWGLRCYNASYQFWHANKYVSVQYNKECSRIGVYLDHASGILEFYNVLDDMSLIYKARIRFTEPVYAGFGLGGKKTHVRLCKLEKAAMSAK